MFDPSSLESGASERRPLRSESPVQEEAPLLAEERALEAIAEDAQGFLGSSMASLSADQSSPPVQDTDEVREDVKDILEQGLVSYVHELPSEVRTRFLQKGQETATEIARLIHGFKATARVVFRLISAWLRLIPGVNKFFLEQEVKLKTDQILALQDKHPKSPSV